MPSISSKPNLRAFLMLSLGILTILVLTGCAALTAQTPLPSPTLPGHTGTPATPEPTECKPMRLANSEGLSLLTFADGSQVFLGSNTEIDFIPAGSCPGVTAHQAYLLRGELAVRSLLPDGSLFTVFSPEGFKVTLDDTGLVTYSLENTLLTLNCSNGNCTIGTEQQPNVLTCGQVAEFDQNSVFNGPFAINVTVLAPYGDWLLPKCDINNEPTPTPDVGATATAACSSFNNLFPLTPCPTFSNP